MPSSRSITEERLIELAKSYAPDWIISIAFFVVAFQVAPLDGFRRDFSIADTTLHYTFATKERVPSSALFTLCLGVPFVIQAVVNYFTIRTWWDLHISTLGLFLSMTLTTFVTNVVKLAVGRPRPDMIARCLPLSNIINPEYGLLNTAICTQTNESILSEGFKSFPSGHSSMSFAGLGFLAFYLAGKLHIFNQKGYSIKVWITLMPLLAAAFVAISRTMDYRHHWQDVLVGSLLGLFVSYFSYRQYYPSLYSTLSHKPFPPRIPHEGGGIMLVDDEDGEQSRAPILPIVRGN